MHNNEIKQNIKIKQKVTHRNRTVQQEKCPRKDSKRRYGKRRPVVYTLRIIYKARWKSLPVTMVL